MVVFDGRLHVHYGQAYVFSGDGDDTSDMDAFFRAQTNGLLGAAARGQLFLITGLHTGIVRFRLEITDAEPLLGEEWEECVETTFEPQGDTSLVDWDGNVVCTIPLDPHPYRVRYHARGMDAAHNADTVLEDEDPVDAYLLVFWPAPPAPDRVVKETSATAAYWHAWVRGV